MGLKNWISGLRRPPEQSSTNDGQLDEHELCAIGGAYWDTLPGTQNYQQEELPPQEGGSS